MLCRSVALNVNIQEELDQPCPWTEDEWNDWYDEEKEQKEIPISCTHARTCWGLDCCSCEWCNAKWWPKHVDWWEKLWGFAQTAESLKSLIKRKVSNERRANDLLSRIDI